MEEKLGRGLSALLADAGVTSQQNNAETNILDIDSISPNADQPRKSFDEEKIRELAKSISQHGILQPLAVRKIGDKYEIIAGERRWRAAKLAGLNKIPVHILDCDKTNVMALALIENLQRSDLNPIEEAEAVKTLTIEYACKQEMVAEILSKSRSYIANSLRLLALPKSVQDLIRNGQLSAGHGKCLVGAENAAEIAEMAIQEKWNVRQLENAMKHLKFGNTDVKQFADSSLRNPTTNQGTPIDFSADPESMDIAIRVAEALRVETKLKITRKGGVFTLVCKSCEQLEDLIGKFLSLADEGKSSPQ